ncbi:MAG: 16S rRNA (adenine(1518)-N(6)/adenine(1519)-N(6))-dimethyltransferase RsmA [Betaproteobacteria bacterium]|nr:16S rRNA (adenine(1518)-N(6)/adenine(1519)-N(6))-dimethyltransferase RsmA [Betaproteobacteria bacterium]MDE1982250.1 16S rRNA (adenine(1518)-N(6)/adenine(1519)-N(6))-dimethyltransferase RsmA [Betaproteobacteria bacterium]MDE2132663.1 16S rRNA (adenine(1518)-N(6)/adenine(1519)-N(6))-dimethyltransferase RsmA [Betaproteobacteria bacterium]MDE2212040.1 16S rRNA (adenine(1518)-N(6)/adenine(1519)-N(6))-dimethyltransferase RsmA [Betaproteobacteria bacterium]MDE2624933.1 16S rRNA (adenine(1518)-N(6)
MAHIPRKRFGQHFLSHPNIIHHLVRAIDPRPDDRLVEIGPGLGALTEPLLEHTRHLTVIELDRDLVAHWRAHPQAGQLTVVEGDALAFDFSTLGQNLRLVGNLPYNISTPLLFHLATFSPQLKDAHFMLQKEVVDRMVAEPATRDYGRLSVMLQYLFHMDALMDVPPEAFTPPPKVMSSVVRLIPKAPAERHARDESRFAFLVSQAFSQRRKMLRSTLKGHVPEAVFARLGIDTARRAETLTLDEFVGLSNESPGAAD